MENCPRKEAYKPLGREVRRFYVDVHRLADKDRKRKNDENYHHYTVDGGGFSKVTEITEVPAGAGDELYVDVVPVELTDDFIEVIRRGVRVFYLRRLTLMARKREELKLSKTARNDVRILMSIDSRWFREVDEDYLTMRKIIAAHRGLLRSRQSLTNRIRALNGLERNILKTALDCLEEQINAMASLIVDEAGKRIPAYNGLVRALDIDGDTHLMAREALAEVMLHIDPHKNFIKTANFFGLFRGKPKRYNARARQALQRLSMALGNPKKSKEEKRTLYTVWKTMRTRERLEAKPA
ncbi:MAG: hypothetical protein QW362_07260 [Candidatus Caldarchaeum sp.]